MSFTEIIWSIAAVGLVAALGRRAPLPPSRKQLVITLRALAVLGVLASLRGYAYVRHSEQPRQIIYLVDQSASIDAQQTQWMARRVASLEAVRPAPMGPSGRSTIIAFGDGAQVVTPSDRAALTDPDRLKRALLDADVNRASTDLEQALLSSLAAVPSPRWTPVHRGRRVILLTDGRQTRGNVERILSYLRRFGVEIYPVPVFPSEPAALTWERLIAPPVVQQGASVPLQLVVSNTTPQANAFEVSASLHGVTLARRRFRIPPGWRVISLPVPASTPGTMALTVTAHAIGPDGRPIGAQERVAYVEVEGTPKLLWVMDRRMQLPPLAVALQKRDMAVSVVRPSELPAEAGRLFEYDAVVLYQIPKSAITPPQVEALTHYVQRFGGGVMMVGLGGNLKAELDQEAPLDSLLPAWFEPKGLQEAKQRVCIVMLIDRSASMMGPRIAATKRAAVELVKQLQPEDLVGVLAFDTMAYVVVEMQPARHVSRQLIERLVRLKSTGGTDILPALRAAQARLSASGATVKHVILLSDGNTPFHANAYRELMAQFQQERISVSSIGIGSAFVNAELLEWLSAKTGGTFYPMQSLEELPQLIARDTQKTMGELPFSEGVFRPARGPGAQWLEGIPAWPALRGYLTSTAKPQATVELEIKQGDTVDPLLTHWQFGRGRVAVFASDADARWGADWVRWPQYDSVWAQIMRQILRQRPSEELFVWVEDQSGLPAATLAAQAGRPVLVLEGRLESPAAQAISADGSTITPLALAQSSRFRWRAPVGQLDGGWHRIVVESAPAVVPPASGSPSVSPRSSGLPAVASRWVQIGRIDSPTEQPNLPPDEMLLGRLAQATNGAMEAPDRAFLPPTESVERRVPLRGWLLPLVLLLFLADIALRGRTML